VTDGQTDGIAVASTALAMRALWRAVVMIVWRITGKIIRTHTHEQFFLFSHFVLGLFVFVGCVSFSFFSTKPRDWLGRTSPK